MFTSITLYYTLLTSRFFLLYQIKTSSGARNIISQPSEYRSKSLHWLGIHIGINFCVNPTETEYPFMNIIYRFAHVTLKLMKTYESTIFLLGYVNTEKRIMSYGLFGILSMVRILFGKKVICKNLSWD